MNDTKGETGNVATNPEENTTNAIGSIGKYVPSGIKDVPVIARDVYNAMPDFYKSALTVMERNHRCIIEEA